MISMATFKTGKIITGKALLSADNYIAANDPIPAFADPVSYGKALCGKMEAVHFLKNMDSSLIGHAFASNTYQGALTDYKDLVHEIIRR